MPATDPDRFAFVLFRPQYAGNIGSAARALKNMGFADLRLVAPAESKVRDAFSMAVHARDILEAASTYPDLDSALADRTLVVGTTCRPGPYRSGARPLREFAAELAQSASSNRIAIVFGPEDSGLSNRELKRCNRLITIPASGEYQSLNLAQAVMVVAYELMMATRGGVAHCDSSRSLAPAGEVDAMLQRLAEALLAIGFLPDDNPDHIMFTIRALVGRAGLDARELDILSGLARQIRWFGEGGHHTIERKRKAGRKLR